MERKEMQTITMEGKEIPVIDSREVAEMLGKEHYELLKEIEGRKDSKNVGIIPTLEKGNFHLSNYFIQVSQFNRQLLKDRKDIVLSTATLNKVAAELCIPINKIDNPIVYSPYKRVNAYPRKVWMSAYPDIKLPEKESK